jgi:hypothetical protein
MKRKTLGGVLIVMVLMCVPGCSHNNRKTIGVSIAGPTSVLVGAAAIYTATVTNDTSNMGVTWSCSTAGATACSATNFSAAQTASGASTTFTAPATAESVTITATSVANTGVSANTVVSVGSGIAVTLSTPPPTTLAVGATAVVAATVTGDTGNGGVNWTCTTTGATPCSASNFSAAQTASGANTTFTAPATAESVTITATAVDDGTQSASANITITAGTNTITGTFTFYASGLEVDGFDVFSLAGAVTVNADGSVTGEQDFNDGDGFTFPDDQITSGSFAVDPTTGLGTLTLNIPGDTSVGVDGVETLAVSFVNNSHALISEFDGSATSSGSMDLQTAPGDMSGGFAFALSGVDIDFDPVAFGGVFSLSGGVISDGFFDSNDDGLVTTATTFSGSVSTSVDGFGRGTIGLVSDGNPLPVTLFYYVVGPEVIRIIDMDEGDTGIGSAYGQGANANNFTNISIGQSVFLEQSNANTNEDLYGAAGQFTVAAETATRANKMKPEGIFVTNTFTGIGDVDEEGTLTNASPISGTYFVTLDGYASLSITNDGLQDVNTLGIYLVDTSLNISDPNNPVGGGGGLVVDLSTSESVVGTGILVPQSDVVTGDFAGHYSFGAQDFTETGEADLVGEGIVLGGDLNGTGFLNDLFGAYSTDEFNSGVVFAGAAVSDGTGDGRYVMSPLLMTPQGNNSVSFNVVIYQASATELLWIDTDVFSIFGGQLQQQGVLGTDVKKATVPKTLKK